MYTVWIRIDETLPWIELKGTYQTTKEAREIAKETLNRARIKIIKESAKKPLKALAPLKATH